MHSLGAGSVLSSDSPKGDQTQINNLWSKAMFSNLNFIIIPKETFRPFFLIEPPIRQEISTSKIYHIDVYVL